MSPSTHEMWTLELSPGSLGKLVESPVPSGTARFRVEFGRLNRLIEFRAPGGPPPTPVDFLRARDRTSLVAAPFSPPLLQLGPSWICEMRTYQYQPGHMKEVLQIWEPLIPGRVEVSPLFACFTHESGNADTLIHIWAYEGFMDRERAKEAFKTRKGWPPPTFQWLHSQENCIIAPTSRWLSP